MRKQANLQCVINPPPRDLNLLGTKQAQRGINAQSLRSARAAAAVGIAKVELSQLSWTFGGDQDEIYSEQFWRCRYLLSLLKGSAVIW